jgi:hypothetical protein
MAVVKAVTKIWQPFYADPFLPKMCAFILMFFCVFPYMLLVASQGLFLLLVDL